MTIQLTNLSNGLKIITETMDHLESTSLGVWVDVGARHETIENQGISHMLEHMAFKGTKKRTAQDIAKEIENVGGDINAYTSYEMTAYHTKLLKEDVFLGLDILSDILQFSQFDDIEFKKEQSVVLQELGQTKDSPEEMVFEHFQTMCFNNQPIGRSILGTEETIMGLTPTVINDHMKNFYNPEHMVVAAAGRLDHDQFANWVEKLFVDLSPNSPNKCEKAIFTGGDYREHKDLEQVHLTMGFEGLPYGHLDYYVQSVLSTILGGGMSSRLFQEVREKRGLVYSVYSYTSHYKDTGVFGIYAGTGENEVKELIPVIQSELAACTKNLSDDEIQRGKAQLKSGLLMSLESSSSRCRQLATQMMLYNRPVEAGEMIDKINAVTKEDLERLAKSIFYTDRLAVSALGPIDHLPDFNSMKL
jgi:predicted Zn-dependent peptidase